MSMGGKLTWGEVWKKSQRQDPFSLFIVGDPVRNCFHQRYQRTQGSVNRIRVWKIFTHIGMKEDGPISQRIAPHLCGSICFMDLHCISIMHSLVMLSSKQTLCFSKLSCAFFSSIQTQFWSLLTISKPKGTTPIRRLNEVWNRSYPMIAVDTRFLWACWVQEGIQPPVSFDS